MAEKRCYSVQEIQEMLDISRPSAYELLQRHEFRWRKVGQRYVISKASFDAWLDGGTQTEAWKRMIREALPIVIEMERRAV